MGLSTEIEARNNGVKVFSEATNKSSVLKTLKKGDALTSVERKGMFWQVKLDKGDGYVSVLKVKRSSGGDKGGLVGAIRSVQKESRETDDVAGTRSRSAVMGVRGLSEDDNTQFAGNVKPNLRAVYFMEDNFSTSKDVEKLGDMVFNEIEKRAGG
jgi:hypothetical protein